MTLVAMLLFGANTVPAFGKPFVTPFAFGREAAISLEFDDSMTSQIDNALSLLASYRFPATFYVNPGRRDYRAEVWERVVPAAGHELANHTMHHRDTVGAEQAASEIGDASMSIRRALGKPCLLVFGRPGGVKWEIPEPDFQRILRENDLVYPGRMDFFQDGEGDITRFPKLALEKGVWRQIGFHGIGGQWLSTSVAHLKTLFDYLAAHREELWIAPTGAVWKYQQEAGALKGIDLKPIGTKGFIFVPRFDRSRLTPFELYDAPLTVRIAVPSEWKGRAMVRADKGPEEMAKRIADDLLEIQMAPQSKAIRVTAIQ